MLHCADSRKKNLTCQSSSTIFVTVTTHESRPSLKSEYVRKIATDAHLIGGMPTPVTTRFPLGLLKKHESTPCTYTTNSGYNALKLYPYSEYKICHCALNMRKSRLKNIRPNCPFDLGANTRDGSNRIESNRHSYPQRYCHQTPVSFLNNNNNLSRVIIGIPEKQVLQGPLRDASCPHQQQYTSSRESSTNHDHHKQQKSLLNTYGHCFGNSLQETVHPVLCFLPPERHFSRMSSNNPHHQQHYNHQAHSMQRLSLPMHTHRGELGGSFDTCAAMLNEVHIL